MSSHYRLPILFILRRGKKNSYELSKILSFSEKRMSSGTLLPILRELESDELVSMETSGKKKYYQLSEKGEEFLNSLDSIKASLFGNLMRAVVRDEVLGGNDEFVSLMMKPDFLKSVEKAQEIIGDEWASLIITIISKAREGDGEGLLKIKRGINQTLRELKNGNK